jgi:hypothetical protein
MQHIYIRQYKSKRGKSTRGIETQTQRRYRGLMNGTAGRVSPTHQSASPCMLVVRGALQHDERLMAPLGGESVERRPGCACRCQLGCRQKWRRHWSITAGSASDRMRRTCPHTRIAAIAAIAAIAVRASRLSHPSMSLLHVSVVSTFTHGQMHTCTHAHFDGYDGPVKVVFHQPFQMRRLRRAYTRANHRPIRLH